MAANENGDPESDTRFLEVEEEELSSGDDVPSREEAPHRNRPEDGPEPSTEPCSRGDLSQSRDSIEGGDADEVYRSQPPVDGAKAKMEDEKEDENGTDAQSDDEDMELSDNPRSPRKESHVNALGSHANQDHASDSNASNRNDEYLPNEESSQSSDDSDHEMAASNSESEPRVASRPADHDQDLDDATGHPEVSSPSYGSTSDPGDADDAEPEDLVMRRPRRNEPLKIPAELIQDGDYFRRSTRNRKSVSRYAGDGGDSSGVGEEDSDYDFENADEGDFSEEVDADEDYEQGSSRRRSRGGSGAGRRQQGGIGHSSRSRLRDGGRSAAVIGAEDSESDTEWGTSSKRRTKRRPRSTSSKARISSEDDVPRPSRVNTRTGESVNYAEMLESDSDIFDENDAAVSRAAKERAAEENDGSVPVIALVCDYRPSDEPEGNKEGTKQLPFSDFDDNTVEFNIHWVGKSFRRNSWHKLEELRPFKGFKKVLNYARDVASRRESLQEPSVTSEELEEAAMLFLENREALLQYTLIDRIVAEREAVDGSGSKGLEYLVKWHNLPYRDCTWEPSTELRSAEDVRAMDAYNDRVQLANAVSTGKSKRANPFSKDPRGKFRRMLEQPSYLHGQGRRLREYQMASLNWLAFSWVNKRNVILADEMGLGKTLQTIAFLGWIMYEQNVPGPFLVVVPLSTIAAWVREFARWLPEMNVICYSGDATSREMIRRYEFDLGGAYRGRSQSVAFHVLLTTPELSMMDVDFLQPIRWAMIAVDEAHRLKNKDGELHKTLAGLTSANRLLVTGTPLQNSVRELWALLHFLHPEEFGNQEAFEERFSFTELRDEDRVAELHNTLRPYIIRRQKGDVEKSLPKKTYNVLRVGMTGSQQRLYRLLLTKNYAKLNASASGKGMGPKTTLRNLVMELKKCCNHPFLFENVEDTSEKTSVETLIRASGKLILLDKLLLRLREKGHRVLVFSQMVRMLDILSDYCRMRGFPYQRLDGSMPNDLRQRAVDHYNAPGSNDYVFLLSTRAGGLGINLATADTVIIFDSDWNPQNDLQAESRAHRIGQTRDVKVFRLLSRETVEEDILERAKRKRVLEHLVIHGVEGDDADKDKAKFNKKELSAILRFGAEKLFKENTAGQEAADGASHSKGDSHPTDTDDARAEEKRVLEADDIDELLARAPVEPEDELGAAEPSMGDSLLNAFKWADFDPVDEEEEPETSVKPSDERQAAVAAAREISEKDKKRRRDIANAQAKQQKEDEQLEEGDAEYWSRVIPENLKDEARSIVLESELVPSTRKRKQTKTFGAESPRAGKRARRATRSSRSSAQPNGALSTKEERAIFRSWKKFGSPSRVEDILQDAGMVDRIDQAKALKLLSEALDAAKSAVEKADSGRRERGGEEGGGSKLTKDGKLKNNTEAVSIDLFGEQANARDIVRRCAEMEVLERLVSGFKDGETTFRLRAHVKAPLYGVSWKMKQDSMLLLGVHRHGLGNWARIAADDDLELGSKMNIGGDYCVKGAPDPTKLTRRVNALFRVILADESKTHGLGSSRRTSRAASSSRQRSSTSARLQKERNARTSAKVSKKRSRSRFSDEAASGLSISSVVDEFSSTHKRTLKDLRKLSRPDSRVEKSEKIKRTKDCLLVLGAHIAKLSRTTTGAHDALWDYVHATCNTHLPGARLGELYAKLAKNKKEREAVQRDIARPS